MKKSITVLISFCVTIACIKAEDSLTVKKKEILSTQSMLLVKVDKAKIDSSQFVSPKYKQGFFCNFEDQLNRKKVPIDFSLGNSKY